MIIRNFKNWRLVVVASLAFLTISTTVKTDNNDYFDISKNIEIFTNLYKELNTYYVDQLDPSTLMRTGIDAMLESLDPYTNYISETEIETFRYITEGRYNGIGAKLETIDEFPTVMEPYKDSPADKAGLKAGDQITEVDGKSARNKTSDELNEILKGFPGTSIDLTVNRPGSRKQLNITLVRDQVVVPSVPYYGMVNDEIGYVALTIFTRNAGREVADAFRELKAENPNLKGLIFDLRGNPGGLLNEAVNISNIFIPKGEVVVTTKGKVTDWDRSFKTLNQPFDTEMPLVVLINGKSASASEIVSGVMQDLDRAVLMGQRSYGKGLVQNTRDVGYNSRVKLTTAKYYIPSGRCIQSVRYEDGEPVNIPDTQRATFRTRNGRTVLDGGGVHPEVTIPMLTDREIIQALLDQHMIFHFATNYTLENPAVEDIANFNLPDWNAFLNFLKEQNFSFETASEQHLAQLKASAEAENYTLDAQIQALDNAIEKAKENELEASKEVIIDLIEKEIASRFDYQRGRLQIGVRNDPEVAEAVKLLNNPAQYQALISQSN
ncbi:MAG: S41 family peptidase [Saprospiraceae bacterium]|nr:S41 family peptidase [Saprospiraceae bacterium]